MLHIISSNNELFKKNIIHRPHVEVSCNENHIIQSIIYSINLFNIEKQYISYVISDKLHFFQNIDNLPIDKCNSLSLSSLLNKDIFSYRLQLKNGSHIIGTKYIKSKNIYQITDYLNISSLRTGIKCDKNDKYYICIFSSQFDVTLDDIYKLFKQFM